MSAGEEEVRAALAQDVERQRLQMELTHESRVLLAAMLRDEMRTAVSEGIEAVLTSERMWTKVFAVLQKQARERTGRFFIDGITTAAKKLLWVGLFVGVVYSVGGWAALKAVWATMNKG